MTKEIVYNLIDYFDESKSGWGYPELWLMLTDKPFAVIDAVTITHSRPQYTGDVYNQTGGMPGAYKEYCELLNKYNLTPQPQVGFKVFSFIPIKPLLSIVCIYNQEDMQYIPDMLSSFANIADYCEVILVETIADFNIDEPEMKVLKEAGFKKKCVWHYPPHIVNFAGEEIEIFDFAEARNAAKDLATGDWILSLDADERLLQHQTKYLFESLIETPEDVGGFYTTQYNFLPWSETGDGNKLRTLATACRIFRNREDIEWQYPVHEQVEPSIKAAGFKIGELSLLIDHPGNSVSAKEKIVKIKKYLATIWAHPWLMETERYKQYLINSTILYKQLEDLNNG